MREIVAGIHTWSVFNEEKGLDFNGHLVVNDDGCVLVDPPPMGPRELEAMERLGPPTAVVITNRHHTRDAMAAAARWRIRILMHDLDADWIPAAARLGGTYRDGEHLPGGLLVVALQDQKSPGESALLCRRSDAIILGDALIGRPEGQLNLLPPEKYADVERARRGLRRLLEHPFEAVLVGDGAPLVAGGRRAVEEFLARG